MRHKPWMQNQLKANNKGPSVIKDMVNERGETCVSIIVPAHRLAQEWKTDRTEIHNAVMSANMAPRKESVNFLSDVESLFQQIDFNKRKEGVGIFVSPHVKRLVTFPFPVTRKILVNRSFQLQELIYVENYAETYYLLDLSKKAIHLFRGTLDCLEEIKDDNFPKQIRDTYEYNKPSHSNSGSGYAHVKDVEKDKSILDQIRLKTIFSVTDKALSKYITTKNTPLLLCGPTKDTSIYRSVTNHAGNIVHSMSDNYKGTSIHDLGVLAWLQIKSIIDQQKSKLLDDLKEELGEGLAICGVESVWEAAQEGRGRVLLVERDYEKMRLITKDNKLLSKGALEKDTRYCDVVIETVNTVLEKNGKVIVVEKGALQDYGQIALILRY